MAVVTYACQADAGSEEGLGWAIASAAGRVADATILARGSDVAHVRHSLEAEGIEASVIGVEESRLELLLKRHVPGGVRFAYFLWQKRAESELVRLLASNTIDIVHHGTYAADWMPSACLNVEDCAVIWGPVGGYSRLSLDALRASSPRGALFEIARALVCGALRKIVIEPRLRSGNVLVVAANRYARERYSHFSCSIVSPQPALDDEEMARYREYRRRRVMGDERGYIGSHEGREPKLLYVGRLLEWKGPLRALLAFARLPRCWRLDIVGDGNQLSRLSKEIKSRGLTDRVKVHSAMPRAALLRKIAEADVMIHPSLHDTSPWVVAEARAIGCPVVCLDAGGTPELLKAGGGIVVGLSGDLHDALAHAVLQAKELKVLPMTLSSSRYSRLLREWYSEMLPSDSGVGVQVEGIDLV